MFNNGRIYTHGAQGVFIDSLAPYCENIICFLHSPKKDEEEQCNYMIISGNVEFVNIGLHTRVPRRMVYSRLHSSNLKKRKDDIDILLLRGPSPLLPAMAKAVPDLPKILLLVASYKDGVNALPQPLWRREVIRWWGFWNESQQLKIAENNLTFVNSEKLYGDLSSSVKNLILTRTTTIHAKDIYIREDTCRTELYRLLFVGRIAEEKGLRDILEALVMLHEEGINCVLDLVGAPDKRDSFDKLINFGKSLGIADKVIYHGFKSIGEDLFGYYRAADVYIIASKSSEGFPRTIWEAFSQSTPVIATKVGSIPYYLKHEQDALLAKPNCPEELAFLLKRILLEPGLRKKLIKNGRKLAESNTLGFRAEEMMLEIDKWLGNDKAS